MQLVELQHFYSEFERRKAKIVAVSVDESGDALPMSKRLNLDYDLLADPTLSLINRFHLADPDIDQLSLHATYIVSKGGDIFYRKVGRRRPLAAELLDAIDYREGRYEGQAFSEGVTAREKPPRPWKGWKLLDAMHMVLEAPELATMNEAQLDIYKELVGTREDHALRKWRDYVRKNWKSVGAEGLWREGRALMRKAYLEGVDYQPSLAALESKSQALNVSRDAYAAHVAASPSEDRSALDKELRHKELELKNAVKTLGNINQGRLRSLFDMMSMLKAMEELFIAEQNRQR